MLLGGAGNDLMQGEAGKDIFLFNFKFPGTGWDLLGREFSVLGTVIEGRRLGRTLGFPTANVRPESEQLPPNGVYAVRVLIDGKSHAGIANVGVRPTVSNEGVQRLVEVHLFDFSGDLYDCDIEVFFGRFVRPEQKFPDLDALRAQIASDVASVRATSA
jgi:riboflavin kinase/FMN adenylyltransferase